MANLRTAMDAAYGDISIATTQTLDGSARLVPGDPFPLDCARASKALRVQQLSLLSHGFPLGLVPAWSPTSRKDLGSFCFQFPWISQVTNFKWFASIVQFRPKQYVAPILQIRPQPIELIKTLNQKIEEQLDSEEPITITFQQVKDVTKRFCNSAAKYLFHKSPFSIRNCSQLVLSPSTCLLLSSEAHGEEKGHRFKMALLHQQGDDHVIALETASPELYVDHKGRYWDVPQSISLDLSSTVSESGFRYRFGLQKNKGLPQAVNAINDEPPSMLLPGLCAKAAFSYEKSRDLWRRLETEGDVIKKKGDGWYLVPTYDICLNEPHAAISGIIGATCAAWYEGRKDSAAFMREDQDFPASSRRKSPFSADLFGSVCCTLQHGQFRKQFRDLTRVDARLDICSASAFSKRVLDIFKGSVNAAENPLSSPRLNLIFQQQVAGPLVFRVDSNIQLNSSSDRRTPHVEELICSLNYSLRMLKSGKVVAWYSPKRKEAMVELRVFEF